MKYLIILFFIGCTFSTKNETISVVYETSAHLMDVTYCQENGAITAEYGVYGFEKTVEIEPGGKVCISAKKLKENNNIDARVYIKRDGIMIFSGRGEMSASVSGYIK